MFIELRPFPFRKQIIVDWQTMKMGTVTIELRPFAISKYPVTNVRFYDFIQATSYVPQNRDAHSTAMFLAHWDKNNLPPEDKISHPVTFVSYDDARAFAEYVKGRLPTYREWLYAAYGGTDRKFPWGDALMSERCNVRESGVGDTTPVGLYSPQGDSPVACYNTIGNVWEWTSTSFGEDEEMFIAVGTGWDHYSFQREIPLDRSYRKHSVGFRVVRDVEQ
jgi:formylglycine-generating enzyme required for sulfatase activity